MWRPVPQAVGASRPSPSRELGGSRRLIRRRRSHCNKAVRVNRRGAGPMTNGAGPRTARGRSAAATVPRALAPSHNHRRARPRVRARGAPHPWTDHPRPPPVHPRHAVSPGRTLPPQQPRPARGRLRGGGSRPRSRPRSPAPTPCRSPTPGGIGGRRPRGRRGLPRDRPPGSRCNRHHRPRLRPAPGLCWK